MNSLSKNKTLLIIVGDKSADIYGAKVAQELKKINPEVKIIGTGGDKMKEEGVEILHHVRDMSVIGLWEALSKISLMRKVKKDILSLVKYKRIDAALLLDFPGFNIHIASEIRKENTPVIYYISPQIWAWRGGRIKKIAERANRMLVILPFEVELYKKASVDVKFVGHPLFDVIEDHIDKDKLCLDFDLNPNNPIIGLLPGSREKEVKFLLSSMLDGALLIKNKIPESQFVLPKAKEVDGDYIKKTAKEKGIDLITVEGKSHAVLQIADVSVICSGTATLEAAILGSPLLIIYRLSKITELLGRKMLKVKHWGLVNILAGKEIVPELEQEEVNAENISSYVLSVLRSKEKMDDVKKKLREIISTLGNKGASRKVAEEISEFLK